MIFIIGWQEDSRRSFFYSENVNTPTSFKSNVDFPLIQPNRHKNRFHNVIEVGIELRPRQSGKIEAVDGIGIDFHVIVKATNDIHAVFTNDS